MVSGVGGGEDHVPRHDHPEIAVDRLGRVDEEGRRAGRGQGRGHLLAGSGPLLPMPVQTTRPAQPAQQLDRLVEPSRRAAAGGPGSAAASVARTSAATSRGGRGAGGGGVVGRGLGLGRGQGRPGRSAVRRRPGSQDDIQDARMGREDGLAQGGEQPSRPGPGRIELDGAVREGALRRVGWISMKMPSAPAATAAARASGSAKRRWPPLSLPPPGSCNEWVMS